MKLNTLKRKLKGFGRISNMESPSFGNAVPNQIIIEFDNGIYKIIKSK